MQSFGERLKNLRLRCGLSQEGLCNELNKKYGTVINKSMISKWENNKEEPRIEYARKLVNYFDVTLDFLLGRTEYETHIEVNTDEISPEIRDALQGHQIFADKDLSNETVAKYSSLVLNSVTAYDFFISLYKNEPELFIDKEFMESEDIKILKQISAKDMLPLLAKGKNSLFYNMNLEVVVNKEDKESLKNTTIINPDIREIARAGNNMTADEAAELKKFAERLYPNAFKKNP